jgi:hypothetical protein
MSDTIPIAELSLLAQRDALGPVLYLVEYFDSEGERALEVCSTPQRAVEQALGFFKGVEIEDRCGGISPYEDDDIPEYPEWGGPGCIWYGVAKHLDGHAVIYRVTVNGPRVGSGEYPTPGSEETRERRRTRGQFTMGGGRKGDRDGF